MAHWKASARHHRVTRVRAICLPPLLGAADMTTLTARAAAPIVDRAEVSRSHLRVCDQAFALLTCSPNPWTLDCTTVGGVPGADLGLPPGEVPLPKLRDWMLAHRDNYEARDAIWRELITRARTLGGDW